MADSVILISACLAGENCRYDGEILEKRSVLESLEGETRLICPETEAGFGVPRPRCELKGGDGLDVLAGNASVVNENGKRITATLIAVSKKICSSFKDREIKIAYLKERSPSCGVNEIYIDGEKKAGMGVTAAYLNRSGVEVVGVD